MRPEVDGLIDATGLAGAVDVVVVAAAAAGIVVAVGIAVGVICGDRIPVDEVFNGEGGAVIFGEEVDEETAAAAEDVDTGVFASTLAAAAANDGTPFAAMGVAPNTGEGAADPFAEEEAAAAAVVDGDLVAESSSESESLEIELESSLSSEKSSSSPPMAKTPSSACNPSESYMVSSSINSGVWLSEM